MYRKQPHINITYGVCYRFFFSNSSARLLGLAHATRLGHRPVLATGTLGDVEDMVGIILLLDLAELGVVIAEEFLLPVLLTEAALVLVGARARGHGLELGNVVVGNAQLVGDHLGPRGSLVPGGTELHGHGGVTPGLEDSVGGVVGVGDVQADADGDETVGGDVAEDGDEIGGVRGKGVTGEEAAAVVVLADLEVAVGEGSHVLLVVVVVRGVLGVSDGVLDAQVGQSREEGRQDGLDLSGGLVVGGQGVDEEDLVGHLIDDGGAGINHGGQQGVEALHSLVEEIGGDVGDGEFERSTGDGGIGMGLDGERGDNTEVTGTTTTEGPVQIGVVGPGGRDDLARSGDNLEGQGLVSTQTEGSAQGGVTAAHGVSTSEADSRAFAADDNNSLSVSSIEHIVARDTTAQLDSRTRVGGIRPLCDFDVVQVVSPDGQGTSTGGTAKVAERWISILIYMIQRGEKMKLTHDRCS